MTRLIGNVIIFLGFAIGIYLGVYIMLYGGIIQIIEAINPINSKDIAIGVIKVLFSGLGFYIPFIFGYCFGQAIKYN